MAPLALARAPRALWIWEDDTLALLADAGATRAAATFARRQGVGTLYVYAGAYPDALPLEREPLAWRALVAHLHRAGFRVQALLGSAPMHTEGWVLPTHRGEGLAALRAVLDYNAAAARDERFDGVHVDIEPHQLPQWSDSRDALLTGLLDLGRAMRALRDETGARLPIFADLPFWLDGIELDWQGARASVAEHAIGLFDGVTIMDYRNHAEGSDGIVAHALPNLAIAARLRKPLVVGVETGEAELPKLTFQGLGPGALERELAAAGKALHAQPAFAGFAIHHYGALRRLVAGAPATAR